MEFFAIHINSVIAGVFFVLLIFKYLSWRSTAGNNRTPPKAGGAWPVIGHLHLLGGTQLPHKALGSLADKYGPIFTIQLGIHKALVVSNSEIAKEVLTTHDIASASRPKFLAAKYLGYDYVMFNFAPYGPYWRELRKITAIELFSNNRLQLLKNIRVSETDTSINELYKVWIKDQKNDSSGRVLVDMKKWFSDLTLNIILRMVVGKRYSSDEKEAERFLRVAREFFHLAGVPVVADWLPFLRWLDIGGYEKAMKISSKEMDDIFQGWLEEHRQKKATGEANDEQQDFMDVLMSLIKDTDLARNYDPNTFVKATCLVLIVGGTDSTSIMLIWALSLLLNNQLVLKKAQEELDMQVGKDRRVNEMDIEKLIYLQAIVKETLRLYPAAPLSGPRIFTKDCTVAGYHVSKGTRLIMNLWKLQQNPSLWLDPSEFRPERFLTTHKYIDAKGNHFELIPFGAGRRICPGTTFAFQLMHLVLANLLHAFEFSTLTNEAVDMTESVGLTNIKATPLNVLITPRLSSCLY